MNLERHPEPIKNFDAWYGELCRRISQVKSREDGQVLLDYLRPYDAAKWVLPSRLAHAAHLLERRCFEIYGDRYRPTRKDMAAGETA